MSTKNSIINILESNKGQYISGEVIGKELDISRAAVSKAIKELKKDGYMIDSINKKGHCIPQKSNTLSSVEIEKRLKYKNQIIIKNTLDSTNTEGKKALIDGIESGTVIIANEQTKGRGRKGREFYSPKNSGIYLSILLRPEYMTIESSNKVTIATAVGVSEAIDRICQKNTKIKWVNDIFLNNKKIGGILTEATTDFETNTVETIIIGIGINFNTINFPKELKKIADSIFLETEEKINRNELISEIINSVMDKIYNLEDYKILEKYREKSFLIGKDIFFMKKNIEIEGKVLDISDQGFLVVETKEKIIKKLHSGEVSIKW